MNILNFFYEARDEVNKIVWPSREQTVRYTVLVIIVTVAVGVILGGLDYILTILTATVIK
ncbi:MAG: preprotein translocase subunit SecE [Candidatus Daviesbacteria bacterium]|nr:preprotein translocase subunit SecE [Candidatus Daviesbacteria bacterium]